MSFLKNLFKKPSTSQEQLHLHDSDLGEFTAFSIKDNHVTWKGLTQFIGQEISLLVTGVKDGLDNKIKSAILSILNNQQEVEIEINEKLKEAYQNADLAYTKWQKHFTCISMNNTEEFIEISFEEKESLYHFNILFLNNKAVDISIDS